VIASVRGTVLSRRPDHVVIEAAGVGYKLAVSSETLREIPAVGAEAGLHAQLISREDSLALYGFAGEAERDLFLMLISVSGIGPKVALAALSGGAVGELITAIAGADAGRFQAVPGIGKRTADRIIVELREKVAGELAEGLEAAATAGGLPAGVRSEAREGLLGLGYAPLEVERMLDAAEGESAKELIAAAIRSGAPDRAAA